MEGVADGECCEFAAGFVGDGVLNLRHGGAGLAKGFEVTPGIRLLDDAKGDQQRVVTPVDAIKMGATHLVIGRSITAAANPVRRLQEINQQLAAKTPAFNQKTS